MHVRMHLPSSERFQPHLPARGHALPFASRQLPVRQAHSAHCPTGQTGRPLMEQAASRLQPSLPLPVHKASPGQSIPSTTRDRLVNFRRNFHLFYRDVGDPWVWKHSLCVPAIRGLPCELWNLLSPLPRLCVLDNDGPRLAVETLLIERILQAVQRRSLSHFFRGFPPALQR